MKTMGLKEGLVNEGLLKAATFYLFIFSMKELLFLILYTTSVS